MGHINRVLGFPGKVVVVLCQAGKPGACFGTVLIQLSVGREHVGGKKLVQCINFLNLIPIRQFIQVHAGCFHVGDLPSVFQLHFLLNEPWDKELIGVITAQLLMGVGVEISCDE